MGIVATRRPEIAAGGITRDDTTTAFYVRLNALVTSGDNVLDLGAGRGAQLEGERDFRKSIATLRGKVKRLAGCDVDPEVFANPFLDDAAIVAADGILPYADQSFDLVFSDWVLEHVADPSGFSNEVARVLRPGGWFCARTPNKWGYIALASRFIPQRFERTLLQALQPQRQAADVFPKLYRMNTLGALRRTFPAGAWLDASFAMNATPAYHGERAVLFDAIDWYQRLTPGFMNSVLLVFMQKRPTPRR